MRNVSDLDNATVKPGDYLILSTNILVRSPPFMSGNLEGIHSLAIQGLARAQMLDLTRDGKFYMLADPGIDSPRMLLRAPGSSSSQIVGYRFDIARIREITGQSDPPERVQALGFGFLQLCQKAQCRSFDSP